MHFEWCAADLDVLHLVATFYLLARGLCARRSTVAQFNRRNIRRILHLRQAVDNHTVGSEAGHACRVSIFLDVHPDERDAVDQADALRCFFWLIVEETAHLCNVRLRCLTHVQLLDARAVRLADFAEHLALLRLDQILLNTLPSFVLIDRPIYRIVWILRSSLMNFTSAFRMKWSVRR